MALTTMRSIILGRQVVEADYRVEAVAELGREGALDRLGEGRVGHGPVAEADDALADVAGAGVARHDEDDVAEVGLAALVVGEGRVVHDLQEDIVDVGMGLLDLVEEDDGVGRLADGVGEEAALLVAHVAGGRADEAGDRVLLLVLGHVEAVQRDAHVLGELARELGLADAGGAHEEEVGHGLVRRAEAGPRALDRLDHRLDGPVLAEDVRLEVGLEGGQLVLLGHGDRALGDVRDLGDDDLDLLGADVEGRGLGVGGRGGRAVGGGVGGDGCGPRRVPVL